MLLTQSARYVLARGLPGAINFVTLAVYTRLLTPADFGIYALVVAGTGLAHVIGFQWIQLVLGRFLPEEKCGPHRLLGEMQALFAVVVSVAVLVALVSAPAFVGSTWAPAILLALVLLVSHSWLELTLTLASVDLQPARYGRLLTTKATTALAVGAALASGGMGASGPIVGLILGNVGSALVFGRTGWAGARPTFPESEKLRRYAAYGLPLVVTFALSWVVSSSDRVMIGWILSSAETGLYAAGNDLSQYSLGLLLSIVQVAAYPLAVRALADHGEGAAQEQMRQNGELIATIALAACAGLIVLAPQIARFVVGDAFTTEVARLIPVISIGAAISGIKAYYLDMAFHLGRNSRPLVYIGIATALLNVAFNAVLLPLIGTIGAAYSNVVCFSVAAMLSLRMSRRTFVLPSLGPAVVKGALVAISTGMAAGVVARNIDGDVLALTAGVAAGSVAFLAACLFVNVAGSRTLVIDVYRRFE